MNAYQLKIIHKPGRRLKAIIKVAMFGSLNTYRGLAGFEDLVHKVLSDIPALLFLG